ncbi:hypothetical protein CYMTET_24446 [Cymbomonas tetramitiformis]|uniref:DUF1995 domain-containing protein n=1 Tax=Cymbomonas tetramitiformis TaxID=36881 RepID=A0AAE0FWA8_9CHLO|nr:hypothetical protein CYMTET_24446 [Cymbomonas tetramitiformis]
MGEGIFQGLPLSLAGVRRILEAMDWEDNLRGEFINFGAIGGDEVDGTDDVVIVISPQSIVGYSIIPSLAEMCDAAGERPVMLFNPKLTDIQSSGGVMGVRGRSERLAWASQFEVVYHFRLLYNKPYHFPIYGALRKTYGGPWIVYKRLNLSRKEEEYRLSAVYDVEPQPAEITKAIRKKL